jgi:hypothetical protein
VGLFLLVQPHFVSASCEGAWRELLSSAQTPRFMSILAAPTPPKINELSDPYFRDLLKRELQPLDGIVELVGSRELEQFAKLIGSLPQKGALVFLGNGGYPLYRVAHALFANRPEAPKIFHISVSGEIVSKYFSQPELFYEHFKSVGIPAEVGGPLYVIDSVSTHKNSKNGKHQLQRVASVLRQYILKGRSVDANVHTIGIPENSNRSDTPDYLFGSWESYMGAYRNALKQANSGKISMHEFPMFNPDISFEGIFALAWTAPRWNGTGPTVTEAADSKYTRFDSLGRPTPDQNLLESSLPRELREQAMHYRLKFIYSYDLLGKLVQFEAETNAQLMAARDSFLN